MGDQKHNSTFRAGTWTPVSGTKSVYYMDIEGITNPEYMDGWLAPKPMEISSHNEVGPHPIVQFFFTNTKLHRDMAEYILSEILHDGYGGFETGEYLQEKGWLIIVSGRPKLGIGQMVTDDQLTFVLGYSDQEHVPLSVKNAAQALIIPVVPEDGCVVPIESRYALKQHIDKAENPNKQFLATIRRTRDLNPIA